MRFLALFALCAPLLVLGCNVSDPGTGIEVECNTDEDCDNGRCSNGVCINLGTDSGSEDMNVEPVDMSMPPDMAVDMGTDSGMVDMGGDECPAGMIDFNLDPADGCETIEFPGYQIESCRNCAGIPNAIAGCGGGGTCVIAACEEGFYDRDGVRANGCEAACSLGECWEMVVAQHREMAWIDGLQTRITTGPHGIIGRLGDDGWDYHSLEGPRSWNGPMLTGLEVVDDIVYGIRSGTLVRSVDHARSFGRLPGAPDGTAVHASIGGDGRYYALMQNARCAPVPCTEDDECNAASPTCSVIGSCGNQPCDTDFDCPNGSSCATDGICVPDDVGCSASCYDGSLCANPTFRVWVTDDFENWQALGTEQSGAPFYAVFGTPAGNAILVAPGDAYLWSTASSAWQQLDPDSCDVAHMVFFPSGDGVGVGDGCAIQYLASFGGDLDGRETLDGAPHDIITHNGVIYTAGDGFVAVSTNQGNRFFNFSLDGNAVHIFVDSADDSINVLGSRGELWRSVDQGQSWVAVEEAYQPFPRQVESGAPLPLVGLGQSGDIITTANGADVPWISITTVNPQEIKQDNGAAFAFTGNGLLTGRGWQSLLPLSLNNQVVSNTDFPTCSNLPCRISTIVEVFDATFDGNDFAVTARALIEVRPGGLSNWVPAGLVPVVLRSPSGVTWNALQYPNPDIPRHLIWGSPGFVTTNGFSPDGDSWVTSGTPECGTGPFARLEDTVLDFNGAAVCQTADGTRWNVLSDRFWTAPRAVTVQSIHAINGAYYVPVGHAGGVVTNASDDIDLWRRLGPEWPTGTDLDFNTTHTSAARSDFFATVP